MGIDIKLSSDWAITSDQNSYMLNKIVVAGEKSKNPGKEGYVVFGNYYSLEEALKAWPDKVIKHSEAKDFKEVFELLSWCKTTIKAVLQKYTA